MVATVVARNSTDLINESSDLGTGAELRENITFAKIVLK
jgi:hypothetical protein